MDSCPICCESFTTTLRSKVNCINHECGMVICKTCFKTYLMKTGEDPHCMNCKALVPMEKIADECGHTFIKGPFRKSRKQTLLERELVRMPDTMDAVQKDKDIESANEILKIAKLEFEAARKKLASARRNLYRLETNSINIEARRKFIMACPLEACRGFLSTQYKCGICDNYVCPKCFEILGKDREIEHTCLDENIQTAEIIRNNTKPCPSCGERIEKISGCDQMWCTQCHTTFDWRTMRVQQGGVIHNPEFQRWTRENGNTLMRAPGDVPCGGIPANVMRYIYRSEYYQTSRGKKLDKYARNIVHIVGQEIERVRDKIRNIENNEKLRVQFLRNKINADQLSTKLATRDHEKKFLTDRLNIYELISTLGVERLRAIEHSLKNKEDHQILETHLNEIEVIDKYVITQTERLCKIYKLTARVKGIIHYNN